MAYDKYSATPSENTAAAPAGAPEGMATNATNDVMRDMMAEVRMLGDRTAAKDTYRVDNVNNLDAGAVGTDAIADGAVTKLAVNFHPTDFRIF